MAQHTGPCCNTLDHAATHCNTLQRIETHCNTAQHTATHRNTPQHVRSMCLSVYMYTGVCVIHFTIIMVYWSSSWSIHYLFIHFIYPTVTYKRHTFSCLCASMSAIPLTVVLWWSFWIKKTKTGWCSYRETESGTLTRSTILRDTRTRSRASRNLGIYCDSIETNFERCDSCSCGAQLFVGSMNALVAFANRPIFEVYFPKAF